MATFLDNAQSTWGLQATKTSTSSRSGQGIKVAIFDTGMDFQHPDFKGRNIVSQSFVSGVTADDIFGHGTHCIGTACGPQRPASGVRRYGVAMSPRSSQGRYSITASLGRGPTGAVIAGLEWW